MLRWVFVSPERWELRKNGRRIGSLNRVRCTWWQGLDYDTWMPLPSGGNYLQQDQNVRFAAQALERFLGLR